MLDGVERCAHDITAMMLDTPDERVPEVLDLAPLAVRAGQNTELTFRGKVEVVAERAMVRASSTDVARMLNNLLENGSGPRCRTGPYSSRSRARRPDA